MQFMAREAAIRQQIKSNFKPKDGSKRKAQRKPAWAHTEESKQDEDEVLAEEELDQLIQFTENLDFDRYLDTEEVVTLPFTLFVTTCCLLQAYFSPI